jgi:hypothetical protein
VILEPQFQLCGKPTVAASAVTSPVRHGQVPFGVRPTLRNRNQVVERQVAPRHFVPTNVAEHAVAGQNASEIDGLNSVALETRPTTQRAIASGLPNTRIQSISTAPRLTIRNRIGLLSTAFGRSAARFTGAPTFRKSISRLFAMAPATDSWRVHIMNGWPTNLFRMLCRQFRPTSALGFAMLDSNPFDVAHNPRTDQCAVPRFVLAVPSVAMFWMASAPVARILSQLFQMVGSPRFLGLLQSVSVNCGIRACALQNMLTVFDVAALCRFVHARNARVASPVGVLGMPARYIELVEWLGEAAHATRLHAAIVHASVTGQVTA